MKILFQGDSITDVGRNNERGSMCDIGQGYALIVSAKLGCDYPGKFEFVNRGISGNRIVDLYARIKADCWNLCPDVLSILLVNGILYKKLVSFLKKIILNFLILFKKVIRKI